MNNCASRMIIVRLEGGLGNQLFQWALGRSLSQARACELKFDDSHYRSQQRDPQLASFNRFIKLGHFSTEITIASEEEVEYIKSRRGPLFVECLPRRIKGYVPRFWGGYIRESALTFDKRIMRLPSNVYLEGYWASQKYFMGIRDVIHKELTIRDTAVRQYASEYVTGVRRAYSRVVALHVRRGDLAYSHEVLKKPELVGLALLPKEYFERAMHEMGPECCFIVFSDSARDILWCKDAFRGSRIVFSEGHSDIQDFAIMQACDDIIISNSTFSWWAAWLNRSMDKRVIAPLEWYSVNSPYTHDMEDYLPPSWKRI